MMTTTPDWAENARVHDLRLAMWEWRVDPVGGHTRLVKDIAREHGASRAHRAWRRKAERMARHWPEAH
jgi:hypothetical protein